MARFFRDELYKYSKLYHQLLTKDQLKLYRQSTLFKKMSQLRYQSAINELPIVLDISHQLLPNEHIIVYVRNKIIRKVE